MKTITRNFLAAALLSTAMLAAPALAADASSGSEGSGETSRDPMAGNAELSETVTPIEPLEIEEGAVTRDLELDPAKIEEAYGTVTRSSDGSESRQPVTEEMRSIMDGAMADPEVDPAFEAGEESRQVFGEDDRVQINDTTPYPFRTFGLLQSENAQGGFGSCSATLIGPRTVLTAAHCLYDHDNGGWLDNFLFAPGLKSMQDAPFGVWEYETAHIFEGYVTNYQGYYGSVVPWDIAVVVLKQPIGEQLGWMAYGYDDNLPGFTANIVGYPGDKPAGTMWRANCNVEPQNMADLYFQYDCDTYPGSSGSSVYRYNPQNQDRVIYGVNVAESPTANTAVRINRVYFEWLQGLVK